MESVIGKTIGADHCLSELSTVRVICGAVIVHVSRGSLPTPGPFFRVSPGSQGRICFAIETSNGLGDAPRYWTVSSQTSRIESSKSLKNQFGLTSVI
jgi:hypothetical protein